MADANELEFGNQASKVRFQDEIGKLKNRQGEPVLEVNDDQQIFLGLSESVKIGTFIDDDTMATASATSLATSESIKAYVDAGGDGSINGDTLAIDTSTLVANLAGYTDKVGVGTATPGEKVDVILTGENGGVRVKNATDNAYLKLDAPADEAAYVDFSTGESNDWQIGRRPNSNDLTVYDNDGAGDYVFTWESGGNVGIGTTDPSYVLDVNGTARVVGDAAFNSNVVLGDAISDVHTINGSLVGNSQGMEFAPGASAHNVPGGGITIAGGNTTAGTTNNIAGGPVIISGGKGKGTGAGGAVNFVVAPAAASGSSLNAEITALVVEEDGFIKIGAGGAIDTMLKFDGNAADFRIGIRDSSDSLEIGAGVAHGTTSAITIDASGDVTKIGTDSPSTGEFLEWDGAKAVWSTPAGGGITVEAKTASFVAVPGYAYVVSSAGGNVTVTLPPVAAPGIAGAVIDFCHKTIGNNVILDPNSSETINGAATVTMTGVAYQNVTLLCTGAEWVIR